MWSKIVEGEGGMASVAKEGTIASSSSRLSRTTAALVFLGRSADLPLLRSALSTLWEEPHLIAAFVGCYTAAFGCER